jgi:hypothetical protein
MGDRLWNNVVFIWSHIFRLGHQLLLWLRVHFGGLWWNMSYFNCCWFEVWTCQKGEEFHGTFPIFTFSGLKLAIMRQITLCTMVSDIVQVSAHTWLILWDPGASRSFIGYKTQKSMSCEVQPTSEWSVMCKKCLREVQKCQKATKYTT